MSQTMECAKGTIAFCPMLAILFVATRMRSLLMTYAALALKWFTFVFLYGGVIAVIVGVYTMTPETANGRGSLPLAGDGKIPGTDVGVGVPGTDVGYKGVDEPVGPDDLPGMPKHT